MALSGYGAGDVPGGIRLSKQSANSANSTSGKDTNQLLAMIANNIQKLADRLAPNVVNQPIVFVNMAVGGTQSYPLNGNIINGITATLSSGSVNVYFGSIIAGSTPDLIFTSANGGSQFLPLPPTTNETIIVESGDLVNPASGRLLLLSY